MLFSFCKNKKKTLVYNSILSKLFTFLFMVGNYNVLVYSAVVKLMEAKSKQFPLSQCLLLFFSKIIY